MRRNRRPLNEAEVETLESVYDAEERRAARLAGYGQAATAAPTPSSTLVSDAEARRAARLARLEADKDNEGREA